MNKRRVNRLGSELQALRKTKGWSYSQMTELCGVDEATLHAITTGRTQHPSWDTLEKLTELPGVTWRHLVVWQGYDWKDDVEGALPEDADATDGIAASLLQSIAERQPELEAAPQIVEQLEQYLKYLTSDVHGAPNAVPVLRGRPRRK